MERARFIGGLVVAAVVLSACDAGEGESVGPRGGVITSEDGRVTLTIPEGALTDTIRVSIEEVDDGPADAIGAAYAIEPQFVALHRPAMIEYDVTAPEIDGAESLDLELMDNVGLVTETQNGWMMLADHNVDPDIGLVTASITFLGTIAPVEP